MTTVDAARHTTHRWPSFLPDGRHFIFLAANHDPARRDEDGVFVASLDGGESRILVRSPAAAVAASRYLLFLQGSTLVAQAFDDSRLRLRGDPIPLAEKVTYDRNTWRAAFDASSGGILAYQTGGTRPPTELTWFDRTGKKVGVVGEKDAYVDVRLSPDGRRLAVAIGDPSDLWIYDLARNVRTRFTFDPQNDFEPVWSPDGTRIAFGSDRVGSAAVTPGPASGPGNVHPFVKAAGGAGAEERLLESTANAEPMDWSPDGRFLAYTEGDPTGKTRENVWIVPPDGERKPLPYLETPFNETAARFSPDGRFVAYTSDESGREEVYVAPFPEPRAKWQVSPEGGRTPIWRRNGMELFYLAPDNKLMAAEMSIRGPQLEVGTVRALFTTSAKRLFNAYDVSPDGQRFLINTLGTEVSEPMTVVVNWTAALNR